MSATRPTSHHKRSIQPPRWAQRFVEWYCKPRLVEDLLGDLHEHFLRNVETKGVWRARLIYIADAIKFFRTYTVRAPKFANLFIDRMMIGSYIKTSARTIQRNKLFSTINIAGLAISMSVGLLLIAFVHDLLSYDKFNANGSRIYRINTHAKFRDGYRSNLATTSLKLGNLVQEKVAGVEEIVTIRTDFAGDAHVGDNVVPLTGMYAGPAMLRTFTLPMLEGNAATALQQPYSIVLTETAAKKLFGAASGLGKTIHFDSVDYQVTGVLKDVPFFSHFHFESLLSMSTVDRRLATDGLLSKWSTVWQRNYTYLLLPANADARNIQAQLDAICKSENKKTDDAVVSLSLVPLHDIMLGGALDNPIGATMSPAVLWGVGALALIVILSACFNYTNLSVARSMRRFRDVGLRKAIGAGRRHVRQQFLAEAVIVSFVALVLSFGMFVLLRPQVISMAPELLNMVKLEITWPMVLMFVVFALAVGIVAGFLPALFFAKVSAIHALRDVSSVKVFGGLSLRRALVVVQYTLTLVFITSMTIGYTQYKNILAFDLGFNTDNVLNIELQRNKPDALIARLKSFPEVTGVSQSRLLTSVGNLWGASMKYKSLRDSSVVLTNIVDEHYLPLHDYKLVAGHNFVARPETHDATSEVIVNEKTVRLFNIANGNAHAAVGEEILLDNRRLTIVGVMKDFHYLKLDEDIKPVVFTYLTPDAHLTSDKRDGLLNVRLSTNDPVATMTKIQDAWKSVDPVHPFEARFYDDAIEDAYYELSAMIKIIGFLSFIAVSIASLGLLGMVVFATETRLKEMSVRKVMGATTGSLVILLSRGFLVLLVFSAMVALPLTYVLFEKVVLTRFPFHEPIGIVELFAGVVAVLTIAFCMIGSQTVQAARRNPAEVLKCE